MVAKRSGGVNACRIVWNYVEYLISKPHAIDGFLKRSRSALDSLP